MEREVIINNYKEFLEEKELINEDFSKMRFIVSMFHDILDNVDTIDEVSDVENYIYSVLEEV